MAWLISCSINPFQSNFSATRILPSYYPILCWTSSDIMIFLFPTLFLIFNPFQSNFLPPAYSPALIYFGRERGWWVTCNSHTVLKEKNRKSTTYATCWLKSVLHEEKCWEQENHNVGRSMRVAEKLDWKGLKPFAFLPPRPHGLGLLH
jgi:hypothetical protein